MCIFQHNSNSNFSYIQFTLQVYRIPLLILSYPLCQIFMLNCVNLYCNLYNPVTLTQFRKSLQNPAFQLYYSVFPFYWISYDAYSIAQIFIIPLISLYFMYIYTIFASYITRSVIFKVLQPRIIITIQGCHWRVIMIRENRMQKK